MNKKLRPLRTIAALMAILLSFPALAAQYYWTGGGGIDQNWTTSANWTPAGPPLSTDTALFGVDVTVGDSVTVNNIVPGNTTVVGLSYTNSVNNTWHVTSIPVGVTLTVNGPLTVGGATGVGLTSLASVSGSGTLVVTGMPLNVGNNGSAALLQGTTLELTGLNTFIYNASAGVIATGIGNRSIATINLASVSNYVTVGTMNLNTSSSSSSGSGTALRLGAGTNILNVGTLNLAAGRTSGTMTFTDVNGGLRLRGTGGTDNDRASIVIGLRNFGASAGGITTGTLGFDGHPVDMKVGTFTVGQMTRAGTEANLIGNGVLQFNQGTVDATTINMGVCSGNSPTAGALGSITVGANATLVAGSISMANLTSPGVGSYAAGTLTINGGIVNCVGSIVKTTGGQSTNTITIDTGGRLYMGSAGRIGTPTLPTDSLTMNDATIRISPANSTTNVVATTLTTGGAGNVIDIDSLPGITTYPATFRLIKYSGAIQGLGFNFTMTGLPGVYTGSLVDNSAQGTVDLVITAGPVAQTISWNGNINGNWDILSTKNWRTGVTSTNYFDGDFATFNDTASGTTSINLTTELSPGSLTVSNNSLNYTFSGTGRLTGSAGLTKQGSGSLVINNTGVSDFGGAIVIGGGTLQIGNGGTSGNIGGGVITDNATLALNRSDDFALANNIGGAASGAINKNGAGVVTLNGANTFTGAVVVAQGTLKAGTSAALGSTNGTTTVNSGATLDIGLNTVNLGLERVFVSGTGVGNNGAIINSSGNNAFANANIALVTMTADTRFGGSGRWDLRAAGGTAGDPTSAQLSTGGNGYTLTKVGTNTVSLVSITVDPALGDIDIQSGTLGVEGNITSMGNPASTLTIRSNAIWRFFQVTNLLSKNVVIQDGGIVENNSGANTVIALMTLSGTGIINAGGTSLTLSNAIGGTGGFVKIGGSTLTLTGGNDTYLGNTVVSNGTLLINNTASGGGTLTTLTNTTLGGTGNHTGSVNVGGTLQPGGAAAYGTLTSGNLTLQPGATLTFDLNSVTTTGSGINDLLQVNGNVTGNDNQITVNMLNSSLAAGTYRLINYSGALVGTLNPTVTIGGGLSRYVFTLNTNTPGQVNLVVSGSPVTLAWSGSAGTSWDINSTPSWINQTTTLADVFFQGDRVWLNDTALGFQLDISAGVSVVPSLITNDSGNSFNINGPGKISGTTSIVKTGLGTLTISSTNDFSGTVLIANGVLNADNNSALGNTTGGTTVLNGGTLDVGSPTATADSTKNLGTEPITVSGSGYSGMGAIVNNATRQEINAVRVVTLAGNTTFGGNARWDIRGAGANLSTGGNAYNITKIGGAQVSLVATTVDPALGNIDVQQGTFSIETTTTSAGNPANTITVQSGSTLQMFNLTVALNKVIVLNGDGSRGTISNASGANVIVGPITLNGPCLLNAGGTSLTLSNSVSGSGSLTKTSGGLLNLAGAVSYTGETVVSGGTLALLGSSSLASSSNITLAAASTVIDVSARTDGKLTIGSGKSLIGFGTVRGSLAVSSGGTVSPGNDAVTLPIGNLFVTNAVTLGGTNVMQTDKLNATNDLIAGAASIAFGGRLVISDVNSVAYADGDVFKLFDATSYSGSFVIEPASPAVGLYWDQGELATSGILKVVSTPPPPTPPSISSVSRSGGNLVIAGSGGPPNGNYYVLTSTNLAQPRSSWASLVTNSFDPSGNFSFPTPINPSNQKQFYLLKLP